MLINLANFKRIKFLFETELQYNVAWRVAMNLCYKYTVSTLRVWPFGSLAITAWNKTIMQDKLVQTDETCI